MASITLKGNKITTSGELPKVGSQAPDFRLVDAGLKDLSLAEFAGKRKVLNIVPSLDTSVCATSTRKFNEKASGLGNVAVLIVSSDLPFAQKRFCETEGLKSVTAAKALFQSATKRSMPKRSRARRRAPSPRFAARRWSASSSRMRSISTRTSVST